MPWGEVLVKGPVGEKVYINGNYKQAAGETNNKYNVEYGENTFETLDSNSKVELRAKAAVNKDKPYVEVELRPVSG